MLYSLKRWEKRVVSVPIFLMLYMGFSALFGIEEMTKATNKWKAFFHTLPDMWYLKAALSAVIVYLLVFAFNNSLDIKAEKVGNGQHGSADWITNEEKKKTYISVPFGSETVPGFVVGVNLSKKEWLIDTSGQTILLSAPPGGGKTMCNLIPAICYNARVNKHTGKGASMILTDCKGDLYRKTKLELKSCGYNICVLDFRNPLSGMWVNLMHNVNQSIDRYRKATKENERLHAYARAERYAKILSESLVDNMQANEKSENSAYFNNTAKGLITALVLLVSEYGEESERHIISVFRLIIELNGLDEDSSTGELQKTKMEKLLREIGNDRLINYAGASITADVRATMDVYSTALMKLAGFIDAELEQLVCSHSPEIDAQRFVERPTAIFLICPDENTTRHFFVSLFIRYFTNELIEIAETKYHGVLPHQCFNIWDEFGNMPAVKDAQAIFTASRSRKIRVVIAIQSQNMLSMVYGREGAAVILKACQMFIFTFLAPTDLDTAKRLSETLGRQTVLSGSVSSGKGYTSTQNMIGKALLFPDEIIHLPFSTFIVMKSGVASMKTKLPYCAEYLKLQEDDQTDRKELQAIHYLTIDKIKLNILRRKYRVYRGMFN